MQAMQPAIRKPATYLAILPGNRKDPWKREYSRIFDEDPDTLKTTSIETTCMEYDSARYLKIIS